MKRLNRRILSLILIVLTVLSCGIFLLSSQKLATYYYSEMYHEEEI